MQEAEQAAAVVGGTLSGRVGPTVFARSRFGPYSYTWAPRTDPATGPQISLRAAFRLSAMFWPYDLPARRAAWDVYAQNVHRVSRVGNKAHPTGFNRYMGAATLRNWTGYLPPVTAPTVFTLARLGAPEYRPHRIGTTVFVFYDLADPWRHQANGRLFLYQSTPKPITVNYWTGPFINFATVTGHPITPPIWTRFTLAHPVVPGRPRIFFRITAIEEDNRLSPQNIQHIDYPGF